MQYNIKAILSTCTLQMSQSFSRATFRFCILVQPIMYAFILYMMYKGGNRESFAAYVMLGTGLLSLWSSICFSSAGDIERERFMGTLENISSVPIDFKTIILGKVLGNTILGILGMIISIAFVMFFFGESFIIKNTLFFTIGFIVSMLSFMAIAMLISTIFTLSRNARALMNCLEYPVFILCGIVFPIEILPTWTRIFSYILSPTWAVKVLRAGILGVDNYAECYNNLLILILISIIYMAIAVLLFKKINTRTRITASLGVH